MSAVLPNELLADAFARVAEGLPGVFADLDSAAILWQPDPQANSIGWLVWHLTRVQDDHLAGVGGVGQVWLNQGWQERFGLPYPRENIGYGQDASDVAAFDVSSPEVLLGYHAEVHAMTLQVVGGLSEPDYSRIVDERWDPPVTAAVRLVSVVNDVTAHLGQAQYLHGMAVRRDLH